MVFTWKAIRSSCVPTASAITEVFEEARRAVAQREQLFFAAVFYGSVPRRAHTPFSDLDWYVVINPTRDSKARAVISGVNRFAAKRFTASCAHVFTPEDILVQPTLFGPSYVALWGQLREQGLVFGRPEHFAAHCFANVQEEMRSRIAEDHAARVRHWERLLQHTQAHAGDAWAQAFVRKTRREHMRPLHFFWNVARKLLYWRDGHVADQSKPSVFSAMFDDRRFRTLLPLFSELRLADEEYVHLFARTRSGLVDEETYYQRLGRILSGVVGWNRELHERSRAIICARPIVLARRKAA